MAEKGQTFISASAARGVTSALFIFKDIISPSSLYEFAFFEKPEDAVREFGSRTVENLFVFVLFGREYLIDLRG